MNKNKIVTLNSFKKIDKITDQFSKDAIFHGANSFAVMIYKHNNLLYYKSTNQKWQDFYYTSKEKDNCHIVHAGLEIFARKKTNYSLVWDALHPTHDDAQYLNEKRLSFDHCHGVSMCEAFPNGLIFTIVLTSSNKNEKFSSLVLKDKGKLIDYMRRLNYIEEYSLLKESSTSENLFK
ncbi:MAG: hypothetical protein KBD25_01115 [Rickettsiaceae bacterium]|nr:hypothetical protein [Rickettsiaceae bacterium]